MSWRHVLSDLSKGEAEVKTGDIKEYKWLRKYCGEKGLWTGSNSLHTTEEYCSGSNKTEQSNEAANLGIGDKSLTSGFLGMALKEYREE